MVTASLIELDTNKLLVKLEKPTRVEFPRDVIEVSLEPKLNMLFYIMLESEENK
jgi:hypothetical protein